jgi:hypothetical protein
MNVELNEGLGWIDNMAFGDCSSLQSIRIPSTIKMIEQGVFRDCEQLRNVELNEGLEQIDEGAFKHCKSLTSIAIPSTIKVIGWGAFWGCSQLVSDELNEGLEWIDKWAFINCTSLEWITIPSNIVYIHRMAFDCCNSLVAITFSEEMEQFVNVESLPWWNHGVSGVSLMTYSFLAQYNIPARLSTIKVQNWKINIHDMLRHIPELQTTPG